MKQDLREEDLASGGSCQEEKSCWVSFYFKVILFVHYRKKRDLSIEIRNAPICWLILILFSVEIQFHTFHD